MQKIVLFGAGKIGRSLLGQLFSRSGFEVVFVDISEPIIQELNKRNSYKVVIKAQQEEIIEVKNVRGLLLTQQDSIAKEISTASVVGVSVGQKGLPGVITLLALGLRERFKRSPKYPLDIFIAENLRNASLYFREKLIPLLPKNYPFEQLVGLVETSIGKMVPIMSQKDLEEDILQVFAEPYNTLILDKLAFKNTIPDISGLAPKENMKAWVDRKLFIHNLGHAVAAYVGFTKYPQLKFIYEILSDEDVRTLTRETMLEAANILLTIYPNEFTHTQLEEHIDDLIFRFRNPYLKDTVFRVGCDLYRKLAKEDRLIGALKLAYHNNLPYQKILYAACCGLFFRATDEHGNMLNEDKTFISEYFSNEETAIFKLFYIDPIVENQLFNDTIDTINKLKKTLG